MFIRLLRPALSLLVVMTALLGFAYPALVTTVAQLAFPHEAAGSLITLQGELVGSKLVGQSFSDPRHVWGRPAATTPQPYNSLASTGSNLGPLNPALIDAVRANAQALRAADPGNLEPIPVDLVTASASGLDPDISLAGAQYQAGRVARARGMPGATVEALLLAHAHGRVLGLYGEARVNVLELNLALDHAH